MYCGTDTTNAPDSIAMWRMLASQPSLSSAVGASQICGPAAVDRVAGQRHPVLPADQPADAADRRVRHLQVVALADAVEEALVMGRHQLAVA